MSGNFINDRNIATDTLIVDKIISDPSKGVSSVAIVGPQITGTVTIGAGATLTSPSVTSPTISSAIETTPVRRDEIAPVVSTSTAISPGIAASGTIYVLSNTSTTQNVTLPTAAAGLAYTFVCGNAGGEIILLPATTELVSGKGFASSTGVKNTGGSNAVGDTCRIVGAGAGVWWADVVTGTWANT